MKIIFTFSDDYFIDEARHKVMSLFTEYDYMAGFNTQEGSLIESTMGRLARLEGSSLDSGVNIGVTNIFLNEYFQSYFPLSYQSKKEDIMRWFFEGITLGEKGNPEAARAVMDVYADLLFGSPTLTLLDAHSAQDGGNTYMYIFNYATEASRESSPPW